MGVFLTITFIWKPQVEVGRANRWKDPGFLNDLEAIISALKFLLSCKRKINLSSLSLWYLEVSITCNQTLWDTGSNIIFPGNSRENIPNMQVTCIIFLYFYRDETHASFQFASYLDCDFPVQFFVCFPFSNSLFCFLKREETCLLRPVIHDISS